MVKLLSADIDREAARSIWPEPFDFLDRCAALERRGLSRAVVDDLRRAGLFSLLGDAESATDEQIDAMNETAVALHRALSHPVGELRRVGP